MKKILAVLMVMLLSCMPLSVAPAEALPKENFDTMLPVLDSILRCCVENDMVYDPANPDFFWSALYYYCVNWAADDPECEVTNGELRVPVEKMKAYAAAFFDGFEAFPAPRADCVIRYDADWQSYFMPLSDASDSELRVTSAYDQPNGSVSVRAELVGEGGKAIAALNAFLVPTEATDLNDQFPFSVSDALVEADE